MTVIPFCVFRSVGPGSAAAYLGGCVVAVDAPLKPCAIPSVCCGSNRMAAECSDSCSSKEGSYRAIKVVDGLSEARLKGGA